MAGEANSNAPPFDPLNCSPEEEADMVAGYIDGARGVPPTRESLAYAWGRGSAARDRGDEPDAQRQEVELRRREALRQQRRASDAR